MATPGPGWSWGSAWGDEAQDEQEDEGAGMVRKASRGVGGLYIML